MISALRLTILGILLSATAYSQEMWGIANSNYGGNFAIDLNPASMAFSPIKYELNVLSGNVTFQNDYLYIPKGEMSIGKFFKGNYGQYNWQDNYTTSDKNAYLHGMVKGPSFFTRIGQTAFGVHSALRADASVRNVDFQMAKFFYESSQYLPLQRQELEASNNQLAALVYGEIGGSVAQQFKISDKNRLAAGVTVNYLLGMDGMYANIDHMHYKFDDETYLQVADLQAQYGYAMPDDESADYLKIRGRGFSTTWGVQYIHNLNPEAYNVYASRLKLKKYQYKLGISLVDAGSILFTKQTRNVEINNNSFNWDGIDTTQIKNVSYLGELIRSKIFDDSTSGYTVTRYRAQLPAALSLQFDYSLTSYLYINASLIQPLTSKTTGVRRPAQISLTPRIELWRYEFSMPVSLYEYNQMRLGACLRLGQVVVGSDYLTSLLGLSKFNGCDIYIGIKHSSYAMDKLSKRKKRKVKDDYSGEDLH